MSVVSEVNAQQQTPPAILDPGTPVVSDPRYSGHITPWYSKNTVTGDASGGTVKLITYTNISASRSRMFLALTSLQTLSSDTGASTLMTYVDIVDWQEIASGFIGQGVTTASTVANYKEDLITPALPVNFGELVTGQPGDIQVVYGTNVNGAVYYAQLRGLISDRPFVVPRTVVP